MSRNQRENDASKAFFGDDFDFGDEDEAAESETQGATQGEESGVGTASSEQPAASPPPVAAAEPAQAAEPAPAAEQAPPPAAPPPVLPRRRVADEPTMVFSKVPTLPPEDEDDDVPAAPTAAPPVASEPAAGGLGEAPLQPMAEGAVDEEEDEPSESYAAVLEEGESAPLVRTAEPRPARTRLGAAEPSPDAGSYSPPVDTLSPRVEEIAVVEAEEAWQSAIRTLSAEARLQPSKASFLLASAAHLAATRLRDRGLASSILQEALTVGEPDGFTLRTAASQALASADWNQAMAFLDGCSEVLQGSDRADRLVEAADAAQRNRRTPLAVGYLRRALEAEPDYLVALLRLRDALPDDHVDKPHVLRKIADGAESGLALDSLLRAARLLGDQSRLDEAWATLEEARLLDDGALSVGWARLGLAQQLAPEAQLEVLAQLAQRGEEASRAWYRHQALSIQLSALGALPNEAPDDPLTRRELARHQARAGELPPVQGEGAFALFEAALRALRAGSADTATALFRQVVQLDPRARPAQEALRQPAGGQAGAAWLAEVQPLQRTAWGRAVVAAELASLTGEAAWVDSVAGELGREHPLVSRLTLLQAAARKDVDAVRRGLQRMASSAGMPAAQGLSFLAAFAKSWVLDPDAVGEDLLGDDQGTRRSLLEWRPLVQAVRGGSARSADGFELSGLVAVGDDRNAVLALAVAAGLREGQPLSELLALAEQQGGAGELVAGYRELYGGPPDPAEQARSAEHPQERAWWWFAAALQSRQLSDIESAEAVLGALQSDHPGLAILEPLGDAVVEGLDWAARVAKAAEGQPDPSKAFSALKAASLFVEAGEPTAAIALLRDLSTMVVGERPLEAAAGLADQLGDFELAADLLRPLGDRQARLELTRINARKLRQPAAAMELAWGLLDEDPADVAAALLAAEVAVELKDRESIIRAQSVVALHARRPQLRSAFATWSAALLEQEGRLSEAVPLWAVASEGRPSSEQLRFAWARALASSGADSATLEAAAASIDPVALAELYEQARDDHRAAAAWGRAASGAPSPIPWLLLQERCLSRAESWRPLYGVLGARRAEMMDPSEQARIDANRRWLLQEKLADTDEAWDLYRALHEEVPEDREVTEALARIAAARGETNLAIQYLKDLARSAPDAAAASRVQRRIAEAFELSGDSASARQAYFDALDHQPDDREALQGLRRLAEKGESWPDLRAVIQREALLARGAERVKALRELAAASERFERDAGIAIDAWRAVLEEDPADSEALQQMMRLSEARGEWGAWLEAAQVLVNGLDGSERGPLYLRIGEVSLQQRDVDGALRAFELAAESRPPQVPAAVRMEEIHRQRGDLAGVIRVLQLQADIAPTPEDRVTALRKLARLELEERTDQRDHRDMAAVYFEQILQLSPSDVEALRFLAQQNLAKGNGPKALEFCQLLGDRVAEGLDLDDFDTRLELAFYHSQFADLLRKSGQLTQAVVEYERALELTPHHQPSLEAVGPLYERFERWDAVERTYRHLLQLVGVQGEARRIAAFYTQLGKVELQRGLDAKAYKRFSKALEFDANFVPALRAMVLVLERRGEWSTLLNACNRIAIAADHVFKATHVRDPELCADVLFAFLTKGRVLDEQMARPDKAKQHYRSAIDFDPTAVAAYLRMAELEQREGHWAAAGKLAEVALRQPGAIGALRAPLLLCVAAARLEASNPSDAWARMEEACQADPTLDRPDAAAISVEGLAAQIRRRLPR